MSVERKLEECTQAYDSCYKARQQLETERDLWKSNESLRCEQLREKDVEIQRLRAALRELHEELNTMEGDPKLLNRIIREALRE
jgi:hypothetical protein